MPRSGGRVASLRRRGAFSQENPLHEPRESDAVIEFQFASPTQLFSYVKPPAPAACALSVLSLSGWGFLLWAWVQIIQRATGRYIRACCT